jgi:nicotinamide-nucleotide amidase
VSAEAGGAEVGGAEQGGADQSVAAQVVAELVRRRLTVSVAESLTGGLLAAALAGVPGVSAVLNGAVVAYNTALKHSLLGVDAELLAAHGAVHPDVAREMAIGVRHACAIDGEPAALGISTTGVAGPDPQDGQSVGTAFVGVAWDGGTNVFALHLEGSRSAIREAVVSESLLQLSNLLRNLSN